MGMFNSAASIKFDILASQQKNMTIYLSEKHSQIEAMFDLSKFPQETGMISVKQVLFAHFLLVAHFEGLGYGIGGIGPRDGGELLESAIGRQYSGFSGVKKWVNDIDIVATLMYGIVRNHPFHDVNKRTALLVCLYHLKKLGRMIAIEQEKLDEFTIRIADRNLHLYDEYNIYCEQDDSDVKFISHFLRRSTRNENEHNISMTYYGLKNALNRFGYTLNNPYKNYIDVVDVATDKRVANICFHSWKTEVNRDTIRMVRQKTGLTLENGYDAHTFFHGYNGMFSLIRDYEEPFKRLALL